MKILILILMFFVVSALLIISNNNLVMIKEGNVEKFYDLYVDWLDGVYLNFQELTGEVVEKDWVPK